MDLEQFKQIMNNKDDPRREDLIQVMYQATVRETESAFKNLEMLNNDLFGEENKDKIIDLKKQIDKDTRATIQSNLMKSIITNINDNFSPNPLLPPHEEVTYWYYIQLLADLTDNEAFKSYINKLRKEYNERHYQK